MQKPDEYKSSWEVDITIAHLEKQKSEKLKQSEECFVLVSNVPVEEASAKDIVAYYKDHTSFNPIQIEKRTQRID